MQRWLRGGVVLLGLMVLAAACGQKQEAARKELQQMRVPYNEATFVDRAGKGDLKVVKLFLQAGMNVNVKNSEGATPLIAAVEGGHAELVKLLLEKKADVNLDKKGVTPFMAASHAGKADLVKLLEAKGGKPRFTRSPEGVISDSLLNLEWYQGPDQDTNWDRAKAWVASLQVAGGGWRMPTRKEISMLYLKNRSPINMDPVFKTNGNWGWTGEEHTATTAWAFSFLDNKSIWGERSSLIGGRALAVRSKN